jgi:hypothetical protein
VSRATPPSGDTPNPTADGDVERFLLAIFLAGVAVGVALLVRRQRRPASIATPGPHGGDLPQTLDRRDFPSPEARWLVAVFSSATCHTCRGVLDAAHAAARNLADAVMDVVVADVEWGAARELHRRYRIDAVPAIAIVDDSGGVHRWLLGPTTTDDLVTALTSAQRHEVPPGAERPIELRGPDPRGDG